MSSKNDGTASEVVNALSFDIEDYFHVAAFSSIVRREDWDGMPSRVENNTNRILELLSSNGVQATFFILGWVAERYPKLVRDIGREGHEVACHGYSHELIYRQSPHVFAKETARAKMVLEDIAQREVNGYRAASYSITSKSLWALDVIRRTGFKYDSSIFPIRHDIYGVPGANPFPGEIRTPSGNSIIEVPISTLGILGHRVPVGGGGYFRLFPYRFTRYALRRLNKDKVPVVFYLHPWELDPEQPRLSASKLSMFRHYNNLEKCEKRLSMLLNEFRFATVEEMLVSVGRDLGASGQVGRIDVA